MSHLKNIFNLARRGLSKLDWFLLETDKFLQQRDDKLQACGNLRLITYFTFATPAILAPFSLFSSFESDLPWQHADLGRVIQQNLSTLSDNESIEFTDPRGIRYQAMIQKRCMNDGIETYNAVLVKQSGSIYDGLISYIQNCPSKRQFPFI